jgi:hypothetical protein
LQRDVVSGVSYPSQQKMQESAAQPEKLGWQMVPEGRHATQTLPQQVPLLQGRP